MEIEWNPEKIEEKSFQIIRSELTEPLSHPEMEDMILRVIHTTADFTYANLLHFHWPEGFRPESVFQPGKKIYTDTRMALSGINKRKLKALGMEGYCLVDDPEVAALAKEQGRTRSALALEKAVEDPDTSIYVFGNAPTALFRLCQLMDRQQITPQLVIGAPVGFVGAAESKEMLLNYDVPSISVQGRKGGSTVAAAMVNALLKRQ
ncbi:precorrin-8X methylmutase [Tindallia californiensis]|uniref:Precorrin-8X methylmutase n=1 Tax=Tindallia californiensis TaxID=159292 RepID=A0A1H3PIT7_9FIRM|nr:precorrin-8X methylmutase [Tindallia californiensis]SDZ01036.1 precorrin-8X methylmutase [Tindallia californiensis]